MTRSLFCFGLGYSACHLAKRLRAQGWTIAGTTRSPASQAALAAEGFETHLFERGRPCEAIQGALYRSTHLLSSIPPDEGGDPVLDQHLADLLRCPRIEWSGYLSTTGVYGDHGGAWVDEATPPAPTLERTRRRVHAEGHWLASGLPVHIFRLAGIYGPGGGRNALDAVRTSRARRIVKPGQVFGRIHVGDIAAVLQASMASPNPGAIYNVADDEPAPPQDVITFAAGLLQIEPPPEIPFEQADLSPAARSFYADNRRVSNRRIKDELGVRLRYPSYREGLQDLLTAGVDG